MKAFYGLHSARRQRRPPWPSTVASFRAAQGCNKWEAREVFILDLSVYLLSYLRARTIRAKKGALTEMLLRWVLLAWEEGRTRRGGWLENVFNITELMRLEEGKDSPHWFPSWLLIPRQSPGR